MPVVDAGGARIAYDLHGPEGGVPVVLVCGLGQPALSWQYSILPGLVDAGHRVVTFDSRGVAPSDSPPAPYTVEQMAADTVAVIGAGGVAPCHLAGYSLGSWIAEVVAADHPDLLRSVAFIGGMNRSTVWEKISAIYGRDLAALDVPLPRYQGVMEFLTYLGREAIQDDTQVSGYVELFGDEPPWPNPGRLGQWEAAVRWTHDDEKDLRLRPRISTRALVLAFEHDIDSPPAHAREATATLPDATYVELPGLTHLGPFDDAALVASTLAEFFARDPGTATRTP
jgi:pimeloyl-ACP methyl ester carboxylesterase